MTIQPGLRVKVMTAFGDEIEKVTLSGVSRGHDFPVVWVADPDEWSQAQAEGSEPSSVPWPAEDVRVVGEPVA